MNLSELELQNLRHLIGGYDTTHCKMKEYAEMIEDCITESAEDEDEDYRYNYDDEYEESRRGGNRYNYRRGGGSRGGRM